nr:hypothetical protein [Tanacetum cinerariifolium]
MIKIHIDKNVTDLLTKAFDAQLTTAGYKLILLGMTYYCQLKVNAARHKLTTANDVNVVGGDHTESTIRRDLQLKDAEGVDYLPNIEIFEQLTLMGVKKLERRQKSRTHGPKRLYKVGLSRRVESSNEEQSLGEEDASKQGKISDIYADKDINMVNVQDDQDMFDVNNDLGGEEVVVEKEVADKDDKGKIIIVEPEMPLKKKDQIRLDKEFAFNLQAEQEEERLAREKAQQQLEANIAWDDVQAKNEADNELDQRLVNTFVDMDTEMVVESLKKIEAEVTEGSSERTGDELEQESAKKQRIEDDNESAEVKKCLEIIPDDGDDVTIDSTPLSSKSPTIVDYKIYKEEKKIYF